MMIGLIPFNDTSAPNTTLCVTPGSYGNINLPTGKSKTLSTGIDIAGSINSSGHIFGIYNPTTGVSDILFSASALNPKLPVGFTEFVAINGFITDASGNIRQGVWQDDGSFTLNIGLAAQLNIDATLVHLVPLPVPLGNKIRVTLNVVAFNLDAGNLGFYVLVKDPDSYPTNGLVGVDIDTSSISAKTAGINVSLPFWVDTDSAGQVFVGSHSGGPGNRIHLYVTGWKYQRTDQPTFSAAFFGASLTMDRNACNWPVQLSRKMQVGRSDLIKTACFGREGNGSNVWISEGWHTKMAAIRADAVLIDMTSDGNPGNAGVMQSLSNTYTIVDACRTARPDCAVFLLKMMKMPGSAVFSQLASIHANLATVAANRSNVSIIDCYTVSGDPALHPTEWLDQYHPVWSGISRAVLPTVDAALGPLVI